MISGPTASGKSTLVNKLANKFHLPVIRKSQLLEQAASIILRTPVHPDFIKNFSVTQIQSIYDEANKYLQARLKNPVIHLIDDHLCVLVEQATIWKRAPIDYISTHQVGWGFVLNPTQTQIFRNYNSDETKGSRQRNKFDINFFTEEIAILFDILKDWEKKGIIYLIDIKNISNFLKKLHLFLGSEKITPIFILNQLNFQDMYSITKHIISKVLELFKRGIKTNG